MKRQDFKAEKKWSDWRIRIWPFVFLGVLVLGVLAKATLAEAQVQINTEQEYYRHRHLPVPRYRNIENPCRRNAHNLIGRKRRVHRFSPSDQIAVINNTLSHKCAIIFYDTPFGRREARIIVRYYYYYQGVSIRARRWTRRHSHYLKHARQYTIQIHDDRGIDFLTVSGYDDGADPEGVVTTIHIRLRSINRNGILTARIWKEVDN